ncbi:MAG: bacteriorhodopsin [SAR324 cluster bacterium]|nr:bacteriorhodopsin [SAR324 cluster bacterium]
MNSTLLPTDIVGGTFWLLSMAMFGASIFFLIERNKADGRWHTTMTLLGVAMLISAIFYHYIKTMWVDTGSAPIILRYLDWVLSHTIQIVLFYVILTAVTKVSSALFWRLLIGTQVMVIGEFLGAAGYMSATLGFIIGVVGWLYILGEVYVGEAARANISSNNEATHTAFNGLRLIISIGWAIYPLGYFINNLGGGIDINSLNIIYNLSDLLNKLIFGFVIYVAVMNDTKTRTSE